MKNLRDFFAYYECCPLCGSKNKDLSIFYSKYPKLGAKYQIFDNVISLIFGSEYVINIDLDSNEVWFGELSFGILSGGDYIMSLVCCCKNFKHEIYTFYKINKDRSIPKENTIEIPRLLLEAIVVEEVNDDNTIRFSYQTDHIIGDAMLTVNSYNEKNFNIRNIKLPLIKLSELPLEDKEKLLNKFKKIILLA